VGVGVRRPNDMGGTSALLAVYCRMREWRRILYPPTTCTAMRAQRTVVIGLGLEVFARSCTGEVGCSDGRRGRTLGKAAESLKYLSVPRCVFDATDHFAVLSFVFCAT